MSKSLPLLLGSVLLLLVYFQSLEAAPTAPALTIAPLDTATVPATPTGTPVIALPSPSATFTPTSTSTASPTSTRTPTLTVTPTGSASPSPVPTVLPTGTPVVTATPAETTFYLPAAYYQQPPAPPGCVPPANIPPESLNSETDLLLLLNAARQENELPALAFANGPTQASRRHAIDMAQNGVEGFIGSDGSNPGERLRESCYDWVAVGQIIGWGYDSAQTMADFWLGSAIHRAVILSAVYDDMGPGYAYSKDSLWGHYWSVMFAQPAGPEFREEDNAVLNTCIYETSGAEGGSRMIWTQKESCP